MEKKKVYDTSAFLNSFSQIDDEKVYVTNSVIEEIIDFENRQLFENKMSRGNIIVLEPKDRFLDLAKKASKKTSLSRTDIEVLALAIELNAFLYTDDKLLDKVGTKIGLSVHNCLYPELGSPDTHKIEEILKEVYLENAPKRDELIKISKTKTKILNKLEDANKNLKLPIKKILLAGSTSRNTFISGKKDLDIFILFDLNVKKEKLEGYNQRFLTKAFPKLELVKEYGEHPYFKAVFEGYDIDFVPGYYIENIEDRKSAVDRTPLHLKYLETKLDDKLKADVIITRKFLQNNLLYGGDLKSEGMPGYLVELLILNYGSAENFTRAVCRYGIRVTINIEKEFCLEQKFNTPLVVIDPTDPKRNVAAAFSLENYRVLKFILKKFLEEPSIDFFNSDIYRKYVDKNALERAIVIRVNKPQMRTPDALWGYTKSFANKLKKVSREKYVNIDKKSILIDEKYVYFVLSVMQGKITHRGPRVNNLDNANKFKEKHNNFYIKDNQLFVEINLTNKEREEIIFSQVKEKFEDVKLIKLKDLKLDFENTKRLHKDFILYE